MVKETLGASFENTIPDGEAPFGVEQMKPYSAEDGTISVRMQGMDDSDKSATPDRQIMSVRIPVATDGDKIEMPETPPPTQPGTKTPATEKGKDPFGAEQMDEYLVTGDSNPTSVRALGADDGQPIVIPDSVQPDLNLETSQLISVRILGADDGPR